MKKALHLAIFVLVLIQVATLPEDNIVIGIYTQEYIYGDHQTTQSSAVLTYIAPTYTNFVQMTGAKVVPIYSYTSKQQILRQLQRVNGVIFTGGQEQINIKKTWTKNALVILEYAKKENNQGRVFPILGICQGLELMLYLTSNMREDFLDSINGQNGVWDTMQFKEDSYYLLDGLSDDTLSAIQDPKETPEGGPLFFYHSNGTLLSTFEKDSDLMTFWNLIGTTTTKSNQTFVNYLQSKIYPFYVVQFHPQRLSYNKQMSDQTYLARGQIITTMAIKFAYKCKKSPHHYPKLQLINDMIQNYAMYDSKRFADYKVYLFNEFGSQNSLRDDERIAEGSDTSPITTAIFMLIVGVVVIFGYKYIKQKNDRRNNNQNMQNNLSYGSNNPNNTQSGYQNQLVDFNQNTPGNTR